MSGFRVCKRDQALGLESTEGEGWSSPLSWFLSIQGSLQWNRDLVTQIMTLCFWQPRVLSGVMGPPPSSCRAGKCTPIWKGHVGWRRTLPFQSNSFPWSRSHWQRWFCSFLHMLGLPWWLSYKRIQLPVKETAASIPGLGRSLEEEMATHSGILVWRMPWTEQPGLLQWVIGL